MSQILVYHGTPRLYPELEGERGTGAPPGTGLGLGMEVADVPALITPDDKASGVGIAAIRFPKPVRLAALRVIPGGVVHAAGAG